MTRINIIKQFCNDPSKYNFNRLNDNEKYLFKKYSMFCVNNKIGNYKLASHILKNYNKSQNVTIIPEIYNIIKEYAYEADFRTFIRYELMLFESDLDPDEFEDEDIIQITDDTINKINTILNVFILKIKEKINSYKKEVNTEIINNTFDSYFSYPMIKHYYKHRQNIECNPVLVSEFKKIVGTNIKPTDIQHIAGITQYIITEVVDTIYDTFHNGNINDIVVDEFTENFKLNIQDLLSF